MSGDFSKWISTPDEDPLPPLKYIEDEVAELAITKKHKSFQTKKTNVKSIQVALVTDSMNVTSSSDTFQPVDHQNDKGQECSDDESFNFDQSNSAFVYYNSPTLKDLSVSAFVRCSLATEPSTSQESVQTERSADVICRGKRRKLPSQSTATRKCVSCPEATRVSSSDSGSIFSDVTRYGVTHSLGDTMLRKYKQEELSQYNQHSTDTTTLESIDFDFNGFNRSYSESAVISSSSAANLVTDNHSESSVDFSSEEDSINFDDNCSRVSYVSVYRASPAEILTTDATAASLEIMTGSIRLTYMNPACTTSVRPVMRPSAPRKYCKTCTLDGLKYHPACPAASAYGHDTALRSSGTFGGIDTEELCVIAKRRF